jgi:two-component system, NtrC family, response regulator HupR/HoxA
MDDLPFLCDHFLRSLAERTGRGSKRLSQGVLQGLLGYDWPGNIRELQGELERMYVLSGEDQTIGEELLNQQIVGGTHHTYSRREGTLADTVRSVEKDVIRSGLIRTHWNKTQLATELGVSRTTLIRKVKEYGLEKRTTRQDG